jgi:hypothetical protein
MSITSSSICAAADALTGFVGFNPRNGQHIVRFSEDAFGLDIDEASITPCSEFVWRRLEGDLMTLDRSRLALLLQQNIDERLNISEALRVYLRRRDLPQIQAERRLLPS